MRDEQGRPAAGKVGEVLVELVLQPNVQAGGRLVEDEQVGIPTELRHHRPGEGDALPLPAG